MASNAFRDHLLPLLRDAERLAEASDQLPVGISGRAEIISPMFSVWPTLGLPEPKPAKIGWFCLRFFS